MKHRDNASHVRDDWKRIRQFVDHGSQAAFADLVKQYLNLVYTVCRRELGSAQAAEDAAQAVFLVLARKAPSFHAGIVLSTWLFEVCRMTCRNFARERRRQEALVEKVTQTMKGQSVKAVDDWSDIEPHLHYALASLKTQERDLIILRFFEEQSLLEIALTFGVSEDAARMRLNRALQNLRRRMQHAGVSVSVVALAALLSAHSVEAAPELCAVHIVSAAQTVAFNTAMGASAQSLAQGVLKTMTIIKWQSISLTVAAGLACTVLVTAGVHKVFGLRPSKTLRQVASIPSPGPGSRAATWHFVGWRLRDGKKAAWEVWGRRSPFYYREQIGDEILLDDGVRVIHVIPPRPLSREAGVYLVLPLSADRSNDLLTEVKGTPLDNDGVPYLSGITADPHWFVPGQPDALGEPTVSANSGLTVAVDHDISENAMIVTDKTTGLMMHYTVERSDQDGKVSSTIQTSEGTVKPDFRMVQSDIAELTPQYNVPVPDIATPVPPPGYDVIDTTAAPSAPQTVKLPVATQSGITVQTTSADQDLAGNWHLTFEIWLGSHRLQASDTRLFLERIDLNKLAATDDRGTKYISINEAMDENDPKEGRNIWLTPLEPSTKLMSATSLHLRLPVTVMHVPQAPGYADPRHFEMETPLIKSVVNVNIALPRQKSLLKYEDIERAEAAPFSTDGHSQFDSTLPIACDFARATYYLYNNQQVMPDRGTSRTPETVHRAIYWFNAAADAEEKRGNKMLAKFDRFNAAYAARELRDEEARVKPTPH